MPKYDDIRTFVPADESEYEEKVPYPARIQPPTFKGLSKLLDQDVTQSQNPEFNAVTSDLWKKYSDPNNPENAVMGFRTDLKSIPDVRGLKPVEEKYAKNLVDAYAQDKGLNTTEDFVKDASKYYGIKPPTVVRQKQIEFPELRYPIASHMGDTVEESTKPKLRFVQPGGFLGLTHDPNQGIYKTPVIYTQENPEAHSEKATALHELMHVMDPRKEGRSGIQRTILPDFATPQSHEQFLKESYRNPDSSGHFEEGRTNYLNNFIYDQIQNEKRNFNLTKQMIKQKYGKPQE